MRVRDVRVLMHQGRMLVRVAVRLTDGVARCMLVVMVVVMSVQVLVL